MLSPAEILGPGGRMAARLDHYELRPEQLAMAEAIAAALKDGGHLVAEAGTGIGKSFAYLVPAILAAAEAEAAKPRRIVLSTHTISLQEQLIHKDIPFLRSVMPIEFTAVLVKGRGNYLSLRRMEGPPREPPACFTVRRISLNCGRSSTGRSEPATARWPIWIIGRCRRCGTKWRATAATV